MSVWGSSVFQHPFGALKERSLKGINMGAVCWSPSGAPEGNESTPDTGKGSTCTRTCDLVSPNNVFSKHGLFFLIFPLFRVLSWTILWRSHPTTTSLLGLEDFLVIGQFYWGGGGGGHHGAAKVISERGLEGEMKGALHWTEICATDMIFQQIGGCFTTWDGYSS